MGPWGIFGITTATVVYIISGVFLALMWSTLREPKVNDDPDTADVRKWTARATLAWPLAPLIVAGLALYGLGYLIRFLWREAFPAAPSPPVASEVAEAEREVEDALRGRSGS